jgi:hypothetical protein
LHNGNGALFSFSFKSFSLLMDFMPEYYSSMAKINKTTPGVHEINMVVRMTKKKSD